MIKMPDYQNGKIYKILNNVDDEIYVGSTIETLGQRMSKHRYSMKKRPHYKLYKHMHELDVEHFYIELIENYPCNDVYELRAREGYYIREIGTLNKNVAGRTHRESVDIHIIKTLRNTKNTDNNIGILTKTNIMKRNENTD